MFINNFSINNFLKKCVKKICCPFCGAPKHDRSNGIYRGMYAVYLMTFYCWKTRHKKDPPQEKFGLFLLSREFKLFFGLLRREKVCNCRILCSYFLPAKKRNEFVINIGLNYICFRGTFYTHMKEQAPWTSQRRVCQSD